MTLVTIDITDVVGEAPTNGRVAFYSPSNRGVGGRIISTAVKYADLVDGEAEIELVPGPVAVQIFAQGISDTRTKPGFVPDEGPVSLTDVILKWTPALVDQGVLAILVAVDEALSQVAGSVAAEIGNTTHVISTGATTHANKVVRLNADGKLAIGAGTVTAATDPTNKSYVDNAVATKADSAHTHNAADITGNTTHYVNSSVDNRFAHHLVKLNADGKITIPTAGITLPTDPSNKSYVDTAVAAKADSNHSHTATEIIGQTTHTIGTGTNTHANKVVRLDENGKLSIGTGVDVVTDPQDPTNKSYVDNAVATKADSAHTHNASDIVGNTTHYVNSSVDDRFANYLVRLNGDGKITIPTTGITGPNDPANKKYTDDTAALAAKNATDELQEKIGSRLAWWN